MDNLENQNMIHLLQSKCKTQIVLLKKRKECNVAYDYSMANVFMD